MVGPYYTQRYWYVLSSKFSTLRYIIPSLNFSIFNYADHMHATSYAHIEHMLHIIFVFLHTFLCREKWDIGISWFLYKVDVIGKMNPFDAVLCKICLIKL